ncbi:hypothetical protein ANCCAN_02628 [Ancylostoma caninum]|uniref:Uncharacterized protein n=1 Tax=Ancylostoma caninum TaxID=29170 RepID=A0A368H7J1_ANCCA|nr:hypothetical protein ANCCAN_02628 [Ancylostoma caninum]
MLVLDFGISVAVHAPLFFIKLHYRVEGDTCKYDGLGMLIWTQEREMPPRQSCLIQTITCLCFIHGFVLSN